MDYAIFKTDDGKHHRIIHRFIQEACNHHAKTAAREKLQEMWLRVLQRPTIMPNAEGSKDEFSYNHMLGVGIYSRIRFYIAPVK